MKGVPSPIISKGMEGVGGEGSCQSHWHLQLHHHQDGQPAEGCQDGAGSEPGECHPFFQQQKLKEYCDGQGNVLHTHMMNEKHFTVHNPRCLLIPSVSSLHYFSLLLNYRETSKLCVVHWLSYQPPMVRKKEHSALVREL